MPYEPEFVDGKERDSKPIVVIDLGGGVVNQIRTNIPELQGVTFLFTSDRDDILERLVSVPSMSDKYNKQYVYTVASPDPDAPIDTSEAQELAEIAEKYKAEEYEDKVEQ